MHPRERKQHPGPGGKFATAAFALAVLGLRERRWSAFPDGIHVIPTGSCSRIHSVEPRCAGY